MLRTFKEDEEKMERIILKEQQTKIQQEVSSHPVREGRLKVVLIQKIKLRWKHYWQSQNFFKNQL